MIRYLNKVLKCTYYRHRTVKYPTLNYQLECSFEPNWTKDCSVLIQHCRVNAGDLSMYYVKVIYERSLTQVFTINKKRSL